MTLKKTFNAWRAVVGFSDRIKPFVLITVLIPILLLALFGLYAIFRYNYILTFVGLLGLFTLAAMLLLFIVRRPRRKALPQVDARLLDTT
jgi:hypothetical protein